MFGTIPAVTLLREFYASFIFYHGYTFIAFIATLPVTLIPQLKENGYDIDTLTESCLGSTSIFFNGISGFIVPALLGKAGRKRILQTSLFFCAIGMVIVASSTKVSFIFCGLILTSFACSCLMPITSCYISEICEKERRGVLLSGIYVTGTIGGAAVFVMHAFLSWRTIVVLSAVFACSGLLQAFLIPESKYWHLLRGDEEKARQSASWFQPHLNDTEIDRMIDEIKRSIVINAPSAEKNDNLFAQFLKKLRHGYVARPLLKGVLISFVRVGCGRAIFTVYFVEVLRHLSIPYNFKVITAWYGLVDVIGAIIVLTFIHKLKRKTSIYLSSTIMMASLSTIIAYKISLNVQMPAPAWIAVAGLYTFVMIATCGYNSLMFVIISEIQPAEFRVEANAINSASASVFFSMYSFIYPFAQAVMPIEYILTYCVACIALSMLLIYVMFPETSNFEFYQNKDEKKSTTTVDST